MSNQPTKAELAANLSKAAAKLKEVTMALKEARSELEEAKSGRFTAEEAAVANDSARRLEEAAHASVLGEIQSMLKMILAEVKKP